MEVPLQGVAENDPLVVSVLLHQALELQGRIRERLDGEHHVLDDHRGSDLPRRPDGGKKPFPDVPELLALRLLVREGGRKDGRDTG